MLQPWVVFATGSAVIHSTYTSPVSGSTSIPLGTVLQKDWVSAMPFCARTSRPCRRCRQHGSGEPGAASPGMTRTHGAFRASSYLLLRCRAWPADPNVHIADIRPEQVRNGRLYEGVPAVVGTGDMRSAGLPGDPLGAIGSIHRNGRLGGVGFGAR